MIDSAVKEVNGFMSIKRWEDALAAVRRQPAKYASNEDIKIEAYLLHNLKYFSECGELCLKHIEKNNDFDLTFTLKSCESIATLRESLMAEIKDCRSAEMKDMKRSIGFLLGVFCDIRDVTYFLTTVLSSNNDPKYTYLLACIYRISGKLHESLALLESIAPFFPEADVLLAKVRIEYEAFLKMGNFGTSGKMMMPEIPNMNGEDMMVRGFWSIAEKDYQSAFKYLADALKFDPSLSVCWYYVGKLQTSFGAKERGDKCYKKFLEFFPSSAGYYKSLVYASTTSEEDKDKYFKKWIGCFPYDPRSWMAYISYIYTKKDFYGIQLLASEILDKYEADWFIPKENPIHLIYSGILNLCIGRISIAAENFKEALNFEQYTTVASLGLGAIFDIQGIAIDATTNYEQAMTNPKAESISKYFMTNVYLKRKNYKKAFTTIDEVLAKYPNSLSAICKKAEVYVKLSDIKGFKKYISDFSDDKKSPELYVLSAMVSMRDRKYDEAIKTMKQALIQYPESYSLLLNIAILYFNSGDYENCEKIVDKISDIFADPIILFMKGLLLYKNDMLPEAQQNIEDYLSLSPFDFNAWLAFGIISLKLNNIDIARLAFEKALLFSDSKPVYCLDLAIFYASQGIYDKALEFAKVSPREDPWFLLFCAWLYIMLNKTDEADKRLESFINNNKDMSLEAHNLRAYMLFRMGKNEEALEVINKLEKENSSEIIEYNKAFLNIHLNKYDEAEKIISDLLKENPDFYNAWLAQAILSFIRHDETSAVEALNGAKKLKNPGFKSWLKKASSASNSSDSDVSLKALLDCISYSLDMDLKFYIPEMFSLSYNDSIGFFAFDKLDAIFLQKNM